MIKLSITGILFAIFINPANANTVASDPTLKTRTIKVKERISRIVLNGDADVVFVKDNSGDIIIEERAAIENVVKINNQNGVLTIESKDFYRGKKPLILIPASQLQSLELNGDASVTTSAMLRSKELKVFVNGDCYIRILSTGKVYVESSPDYHLKFKQPLQGVLPSFQR